MELIIASAYFPYDSIEAPPTEEFVNLVNYCKVNKIPLLSSIDANAHHHSWGSTNINDRGKNLFEFILSSELMISNTGCKPTFVTKNRSEVLDVTLSSSDLFSFILNWEVTDLILTSDHKCIKFELDLDTQPPKLFRNPAATNWELFTNTMKSKMNLAPSPLELDDVDKLDSEVDLIHNAIIESYEIACPLLKHKTG